MAPASHALSQPNNKAADDAVAQIYCHMLGAARPAVGVPPESSSIAGAYFVGQPFVITISTVSCDRSVGLVFI